MDHNKETEDHDHIEDANLPGSLPTLRKQNISFSKTEEEELPTRIERLWYINPYGQEMRLNANSHVHEALRSAQCVIYSIGSLYTSIIPNLILKGVGQGIASNSIRHKILILNSTIDRETGPSSNPMTATDFIAAISRACAYSRGFPADQVVAKHEYKHYVTHLIHLDGGPKVDKMELGLLGIETIRLYGRKAYDEKALVQALVATIGKRDVRMGSRRNTLDGQASSTS